MDARQLEALLGSVRDGNSTVADALRSLAALPSVDLGHTTLDTHRDLRCGHPEVVFGEGKTPDQLVDIARAILERHDTLLVTRLRPEGAEALLGALSADGRAVEHHEDARCLTVRRGAGPDGAPADGPEPEGLVLVISAGTSDRPVAEEAVVTARMLGARVEHLCDVGVAGIHRLLRHTERLRAARALVVVAGMEGALPSVVGGLVARPVFAVPTSVGYGASFGGVAALLGMLNSCASGVSVVNIDNGFGAGYAAALANRLPADVRVERATDAAPGSSPEASPAPPRT